MQHEELRHFQQNMSPTRSAGSSFIWERYKIFNLLSTFSGSEMLLVFFPSEIIIPLNILATSARVSNPSSSKSDDAFTTEIKEREDSSNLFRRFIIDIKEEVLLLF